MKVFGVNSKLYEMSQQTF